MPEQLEVPVSPETAEQEQPKPVAVPEAATETEEEKTQEQEQAESKPKGGFQRRIDRLTKEKYELSGMNRELRERLTRIEEQLAGKSPAKTEPEDPEPKPEAFSTYEEYVKAVSRWATKQEAKQLLAKQEEQLAKQEAEERDREIVETYKERADQFTEEHEDFNEVVARVQVSKNIAEAVQVSLLEDDNGPALAYYLGEHPEVVSKLNDMTAAGAVRYLGRLSERLFPEKAEEEVPEPPTPEPKAAVQAPAPIKPVKKPSPTATGLSDDLSPEEWLKRRRAQLAGRKT